MSNAQTNARADGFTAPPISTRQMYFIVGGVMLAMLLAALDQTIVAPALPTIGDRLGHVDYLPWVVTAYLLTSIATAPLYGKIADLYGRRPTIFAAVFFFVAGSVVCGLAGHMFVLILGRAIQGLGGGGLFAMAMIVIGDLVPPRERGRLTAWTAGTWAVASVAGPLLGGAFADHLHWSLIFWINLPLGVLALAIMNAPLKALTKGNPDRRLDLAGAGLLVVATTALLLALNWGGNTYAWTSLPILSLIAGFLALGAVLAWRLLTAPEPLIALEVLRNPIVCAASAAVALTQGAHLGLTVFIPIYLQTSLDMSVSASGSALLGFMLGTVLGAWISGRLLMRVRRYKLMAVFGAGISAAGILVMGLTAGLASLFLAEALMIAAGFGAGLTFPIATISAQNAVAQSELGAATGLVTFLRQLGGAIGVAVLGAIALAYGLPMSREGAVTAAQGGGEAGLYAIIFYAAALAMAGTTLSYVLMPEKPLAEG
ncbi:MDR family MFS transporter [Jiella avicenniae]|uniref:MFS transporter n=1 Tax=Jiella avicenniae TaxID=2907202 RepID=A0A9X1T5A8_9HYPH|nr:MDR family MFS transporter [Jiella avicenniae]MCE7029426.1 MFS transporter [Jiella avicenniae]